MSDIPEWLESVRIAVIGLGYVGLPLAVEFGKKFPVIGFDVNRERIAELTAGRDSTRECEADDLLAATRLRFSHSADDLNACNVFIVTVPTPIDAHKRPNLGPLLSASEMIGRVLKRGDIVIYESTVYPGATEDDCVPVLERISGMEFNQDFFCGYSPERINPGDKLHRLTGIRKVTSGSTPAIADRVDALYAVIIAAGTYRAQSIRIAEAAKVIENTQRDLNIALINELAIIFNLLGIDTHAVLEAAGTKWNFLAFRPGLVGGHCIGVDPYYLTHKSEEVGYKPEVILAGRRINDGMGAYIAGRLIKSMTRRRIDIGLARVLLLGLAFKENCGDIRNTKVIDIYHELREYGISVDVYDPWVEQAQAELEYGIPLIEAPEEGIYDGVVLAVAHACFTRPETVSLRRLCKLKHVIFDVKGILKPDEADERL